MRHYIIHLWCLYSIFSSNVIVIFRSKLNQSLPSYVKPCSKISVFSSGTKNEGLPDNELEKAASLENQTVIDTSAVSNTSKLAKIPKTLEKSQKEGKIANDPGRPCFRNYLRQYPSYLSSCTK